MTSQPRDPKTHPPTTRRFGPYRTGFIALLVGVGISLLSFFSLRSADERDTHAEFDRLASERATAIGKSLVTFQNMVEVTRAYYSASQDIRRDEFSVFALALFNQHPGMLALTWAPRVFHGDRTEFVAGVRAEGYGSFRFTEMRGADSTVVPRGTHEEYFPVLFQEPPEGGSLGFDMASNPTSFEAMQRSRDSGEAVATSRIHMIRNEGETQGFLIAMPVYDRDLDAPTIEERQQHLEGFVLGAFDGRGLITSELDRFAPEEIDILFADVSDPESENVFCSWNSVELRFRGAATRDGFGAFPAYVDETTLEIAGRTWLIACAATPVFLTAQESKLPWVVLLGGLAFSLLGFLYVLRHRQESGKIRESESRYRMMVESTPDAIVVLDTDAGRFVDANEKACQIFGTNREELLKIGPIELSPPLQPDGSSSAALALVKIRAALSGDSPPVFQWLHCDVNGNEFPCEVRLAPFPSSKGNLVLGTLTDISARLQEAEERSLLERKLLEAQRLESLGLLTSGIAHDFNNLLTPIMGRAGLALDDLSPEDPVRQHLDHIQVSALRAEELIRQLLAYTGQARLQAVKLCLSSTAQEMAELWEVSLGEGTRLELELANPGPVIEGDAGQVRQVILNLITNAADAVGSKGGTIRVATGVIDADAGFLGGFMGSTDSGEGRYAWCEVSDTGPGMDEETRNRIFDPFFTTKQEGRGLGLATVLGIVKTHHGGVAVTSEPNGGTRVKVIFPLVAGPPTTVSEPVDSPARGQVEGMILVVDDEDRIRHLITTILRRQGFETVQAHDGPSALEVFDQHRDRIRLVLVDYTMPGMSGVDIFSRLHEIDGELPVILMSGYGERTMLTRVSEQGLAGFLQKPFDPKQLLEAVHKVLELV